MLSTRGLPWRRLMAMLCLGALIGVGPGRTFASFSASTDTTGNSFSASRIFSGPRSTSAWAVGDAADGSESDESNIRAFADASFTTTGVWSASWSTSRYLEFEMNSPLPSGVALTDAAFSLTYADNDGAGGNQFCYYFEVRRSSTGTVLSTHGSTSSPVSCETSQTMKTVSTALSAVSTTDLANDITIRLYGQHTGAKAARIDAVGITGTLYSNAFRLHSFRFVDASTGTGTTTRWGPAVSGDSSSYQVVGNWNANFAANRYLKFTFPSYVPAGGVVTGASIDHSYKSSTSGDTTCWYMEVYNSSTLLATKGSSTNPLSCNGTTSFATDNVSVPEIDTPNKANNVVVRVYARNSGGRRTDHDLIRLNVTYSMGATGCTVPGTQTLNPTADSWTDQNAPTANEGTNADLKVRAKSATEARRTFLKFSLPTLPSGCTLASATLRMNSNGAQGTRTLEVYRAAASWVEGTITWTNQPGTAGSPASQTITGTGWKEWTVTSLVQAQYSGSNDGFVVKDSVEDTGGTSLEQKFDSRENATTKPELVVTIN